MRESPKAVPPDNGTAERIPMGNPQKRPALSADFLAGLIVGEGSYWIGIVRSPKKSRGQIGLRPGFSMRMNDLATMELVVQSFKAHGLSLYVAKKLYDKGRGKPTQQVLTDGIQRMRAHLDFFLPLLTGSKLEAATTVSDFVDKRLRLKREGNDLTRYDDDDIAFVERLREINGPSAARLDLGILRDYTRRPITKPGVKPGSVPWNKGLVGKR